MNEKRLFGYDYIELDAIQFKVKQTIKWRKIRKNAKYFASGKKCDNLCYQYLENAM